MASSQAIWNEYMDLSRVHYSADDFYDQSFVNRIGEAQKNIDNLVNKRNDVDAKRLQAEDSYNTFFGNMRDYSSLNDEAEDKFGVKTSMENYEKSKYAVAAIEQSLSALPSTVNRNSNVIRTQEQSERAYNVAANAWTKQMESAKQGASQYEKAWENARKNADMYAEKMYGAQKADLEALQLKWAEQSDAWKKTADLINEAEALKWQVKSDYRNWQWNQANIKNQYARARAHDAFNRYIIQLQYENIARQEEYEKRMGELELQRQQNKERLAQSIVNSYYRQQEAKQTAEVVNAGGLLGRLAYFASRK